MGTPMVSAEEGEDAGRRRSACLKKAKKRAASFLCSALGARLTVEGAQRSAACCRWSTG